MNREKELPLGLLKFLTGPLAGNTYPITKAITNLGRGISNDIVIFDPTVSRHHAQIICENDTWIIKKLVTHDSLTVNEDVLPQSPLSNRDTIGLGSETTFLFLMASSGLSQQNTLPPTNMVSSTPAREIH